MQRQIPPPTRTSSAETALIAANVLLLSLASFRGDLRPWIALFAALLAGSALLLRHTWSLHLALLVGLVAGVPLLDPSFGRWPYALLLPLIAYLVTAGSFRRLRAGLVPPATGRFDSFVVTFMIATTLLSAPGLYLWYRAAGPDLSLYLRSMPEMHAWLVPFAGLGFSVANAAMEEYVFRGVIMQALDSAFGPGARSLLVQAWLFGAMHYLRGFPNGAWGVLLAGVYGLMLGLIRRRSSGLLAPWLTHVLADAVIFTILVLNR